MSSETAMSLSGLSKCYQIYGSPRDRLLQILMRGRRQYYREFWALRDVSFEIGRGEVLGIVGRNGAGKSTLLQMVCGTLTPTTGSIAVNGRVAALLELGAGFNPEFTGRENVYLSATVMGLSQEEINARYDEIVRFSGIIDFIDQPVKTYSSGMYVRLAFSVATSVEPDILVIDEALSVGDGEFSRKSFDRIMALKERGTTILFCSHALYQVEALCNQVLWLENGRPVLLGKPEGVLAAFRQSMQGEKTLSSGMDTVTGETTAVPASVLSGHARIDKVTVAGYNAGDQLMELQACESDLRIQVDFSSDPDLPLPTLVFEILSESGETVSSGGTLFDRISLERDATGQGTVELLFSKLPLMRGRYRLSLYLTCERMIHVYDQALACLTFLVQQPNIEKGIVFVPHSWQNSPKSAL